MSIERFPKSKYLRQLAKMQYELEEWKIGYAHAAEDHPDDWIGSRMEERSSVLDHAILQIVELRDTLYGVPRLS